MATCPAASSAKGRHAHTKHIFRRTPERVRVTRRHHPLQGAEFEVLFDGRERICIRLKDGTPMYIPRRWTDADGQPASGAPGDAVDVFTVESLRALGALVDALLQRR